MTNLCHHTTKSGKLLRVTVVMVLKYQNGFLFEGYMNVLFILMDEERKGVPLAIITLSTINARLGCYHCRMMVVGSTNADLMSP